MHDTDPFQSRKQIETYSNGWSLHCIKVSPRVLVKPLSLSGVVSCEQSREESINWRNRRKQLPLKTYVEVSKQYRTLSKQ